jgi:hypothetical protein
MIFDKEKNEIVKKLKRLHKLKDRKPYQDMKTAVEKKYDVSGRTVERWLASRTPGKRKPRNDQNKVRVPVKKNVKKKVLELLSSGMELVEIKKITGVSDRALERIRKERATQINTDVTEKSGNSFECKSKESASADFAKNAQPEESAFGDKAKEIFRKLFQMDLIADDKGVKIKVNGRNVVVPKSYIEDICLILANAYYMSTQDNKYNVDRMRLMRQGILNLIEQHIRLAATGRVDTKTIASLTLMYDRMVEQTKIDADFITVEKVCKELKPGVTIEEIVNLIKKHSEDEY